MIPRVGAALLVALVVATVSCQVQDASVPAPEAVPAARAVVVPDSIARHLAERAASLTPAEVERVADAIRVESARFGLPTGLVLAMIEVESQFDAFAVSRVGAMGMMQILPSTGKALAARLGMGWRGPRTLFDPVANVTLGIAYLAELRDRFGHLPTALAAYNWGPSAIGRRLSTGAPIPKGYVQRVLAVQRRGAQPEASTS